MFRKFSRSARRGFRQASTQTARAAVRAAPQAGAGLRKHTAGLFAASAAAAVGWSMLESGGAAQAEGMPAEGVPGTKHERTFLAVKPDGVSRGCYPEIVRRFQDKGFKLVAMKLVQPTEEMAKEHYQDLSSKPFFPSLVKFFSSGPVLAMVWEGENVILTGRKMLGATDPAKSEPGTIRGDLSINLGRNICHGR